MPEHDPKVLIKSPQFQIINHQIDGLIADLKWNIGVAKRNINSARVSAYASSITTRTYEEGAATADIGFDLLQVERIIDCLAEARNLKNQIGDLQRLKLRLLNDYDFTKGDNSEQLKIFGEPT